MIFEGAIAILLVAAPPPADTATKRAEDVRSACALLKPGDMLRVEGGFGRFEGNARLMTATGFERLDSNTGWAPAPVLRWEQIDRVNVRRGNVGATAAKGALVGCALVGVAWLAGYAAQGFTTDLDGPSLTMFVELFSIPAVLGCTAIGGAVGAGNARWEPVYPVR